MTQPATRVTPKTTAEASPVTAPKAKVTVTTSATAIKPKAPAVPKPPATQARTK